VWKALPEVVTNPRENDPATARCTGKRFGLSHVAGFDLELWDALENSELPDVALSFRGSLVNYFYQATVSTVEIKNNFLYAHQYKKISHQVKDKLVRSARHMSLNLLSCAPTLGIQTAVSSFL